MASGEPGGVKKLQIGLAFHIRSCYRAGHGRTAQAPGAHRHASDIEFIRRLIAEHPGASRRALSKILCEAWNWRQSNGALRDMVCRGLMLELHRAGHIELPEVRYATHNPLGERGSQRGKPVPALVDTTPLDASLSSIRPLEFRQVRRTGRGAALQQPARPLSLPWVHAAGRGTSEVSGLCPGTPDCLSGLVFRPPASRPAGPLHRLVGRSPTQEHPFSCLQYAIPDAAFHPGGTCRLSHPRLHGPAAAGGLGACLRPSGLLSGNVRRSSAFPRHLLSRRQLDCARPHDGPGQGRPHQQAQPAGQGSAWDIRSAKTSVGSSESYYDEADRAGGYEPGGTGRASGACEDRAPQRRRLREAQGRRSRRSRT